MEECRKSLEKRKRKFLNLIEKYNRLPVQVRASFWFLICSFLQKGISMLTIPIFTRIMSTEEYGHFNVFNSWLSIITIFVTLNLSYGVYTQGLIKFDKDRRIYASSLQGLTTLMVLCWTVIYLLFYDFWNDLFSLTTVQMLAMLVMVWTTAAFNFWAGEQRVLYKYKYLVIVTLLASVAKPIVGIVFVVLAEDKVTARILGLILVELIGYTGLFVVQMKRGQRLYSKRFWMHALLFNIPLIPHYLSQTVLNSADRIMISSMVGNSKAGIYSLAYSLSSIMTLFNTALSQTISPWLYQKIKERKEKNIAPIAYITLILIAIVNLVLILLAPEAVAIFAPSTYYEAIWIIPPVAMSVYFMYSYDLFAKFAFYYEKTAFIMLASVIGAMLNVILNYFFISLYGYQAAGYTTLFCYIVYCIGHYIFMNRVCDQFCEGRRPYELERILLISVLFLAAGFMLLVTYRYPVIRYGIVMMVFAVIIVKWRELMIIIQKIVEVKNKRN